MCLHIFFLHLVAYAPRLSSFSDIHYPPFSPHHLHLYASFILVIPVHAAFFHLLVQVAIFSLPDQSLFISNPNIFYNPRKEGKKVLRQVFVTQPRHQTMPVLDGIDLQIQKLRRQDDWLAEESLK